MYGCDAFHGASLCIDFIKNMNKPIAKKNETINPQKGGGAKLGPVGKLSCSFNVTIDTVKNNCITQTIVKCSLYFQNIPF